MTEPIDFESAVADVLEAENDPQSHVERDPSVFHASQIVRCDRQCYLSKYGFHDHEPDTLGTFQTGTLIHEFLERTLADHLDDVEFEKEVETTARMREDVTFVGRCDAYDPVDEAVYDFKTRASWYRFDPPVQRHIDQVLIYMAALGAERGQIVYLSKSDLEVRTWPEDGFFEFDQERFEELVAKAARIRDDARPLVDEARLHEIPYEPCGCYFCESESLVEAAGGETDV